MPSAPRHVRWTDHASEKAVLLGFARTDVEQALITRHHARRRNRDRLTGCSPTAAS